MKILIIFLSASLIVGCASKSKVKTNVAVEDVTKDDFKKVKQEEYSVDSDTYEKIEEPSVGALNDETIQRLEDPSDLGKKAILDEIIVLCYQKEFEKAFGLIQANHDQYKQHPVFWNQVGTCYMLKGDRRKALLFYNKALEFKTTYSPAYNNLGVMYRLEDEDQKALVAFTRSKKANNLAKTPRFNLGLLYLEYGLFDQAISMLKGLYSGANQDVDVLSGLGTAYLMKGDANQALHYYESINKSFLKKPNIGINYALALFINGNKEKAIDIFKDVDSSNLRKWNSYYSEVAKKIGAN